MRTTNNMEQINLRTEADMNEKIYKTMKKVGAWNIAFGVILILLGVTVGVMQIIHGGTLLNDKKEITF